MSAPRIWFVTLSLQGKPGQSLDEVIAALEAATLRVGLRYGRSSWRIDGHEVHYPISRFRGRGKKKRATKKAKR